MLSPPPASHASAPPAGTLEVRVVGCKNLPETIPWSPPPSVGASGTPESRTPFLSRPARGLYNRSGSLSGRSSLRGEAENSSEWSRETEWVCGWAKWPRLWRFLYWFVYLLIYVKPGFHCRPGCPPTLGSRDSWFSQRSWLCHGCHGSVLVTQCRALDRDSGGSSVY